MRRKECEELFVVKVYRMVWMSVWMGWGGIRKGEGELVMVGFGVWRFRGGWYEGCGVEGG